MIVTDTGMTLQAVGAQAVEGFTPCRALTTHQALRILFKGYLTSPPSEDGFEPFNRNTWCTTLMGTQTKGSLSPVTLLSTQNSPCRGQTPRSCPDLAGGRPHALVLTWLDHQGSIALPELENSIHGALPRSPLPTAALIFPKRGSAQSLLIAKRLISQQSPNLTC